MKTCRIFIRKHFVIFLGVLAAALMGVNCGVLGKGAVSTLTEAEVAAMAKRMAPNLAAAGSEPELPRVFVNTDYVPPTGKTIAVAAGGDFQAAINQAQPGDVITLQAGASYVGNFTLPPKTGNDWIVIRTSAPDSSLPAPGTRMTPAYASVLPKIVTPNSNPALDALMGAHHYRIMGVEFTHATGVDAVFNMVALGDIETTLATMPHNLILDRVYIHSSPTTKVRRGVRLNGATSAVIDSYIAGCKDLTFDSQAIGSWNGPGPYKIVNNYLEGAGENIIFGGGDPQITNMVPSDIEIRRNHLFKPLSWRQEDPSYAGRPWLIKNLLELKNAQRVLIDGNILENNWTFGQNGYAILFTVRNQDGRAPWSTVQDITFTNNIVRSAGGGFNMHGTDNLQQSMTSRRVRIANNLLVDISRQRWAGTGTGFLFIGGPHDVTIDHNTILHDYNIVSAGGDPTQGFVFRNNLFAHNEYGVVGDDRGNGNSAINYYFPSSVFVKNVLAGGPSAFYPPDNFFPASLDDARFVDRNGGNYRLAANSPFKNAGTDGKDIGCDFDALEAALVRNISTAYSVSAASYNPNAPLAAESIVSAFGTGLATGTQAATSTPLPTTLASTTVKVRDSAGVERLAPLFYVSPTQVNYQIPAGTAIGTAIVTMARGTTVVATGTLQVTAVAPGLFSFEATGRGVAAGEAVRFRGGVQQAETRLARFDSSQNKWIPIPVDLSFTTDQVFLILYGTGIRGRNPNGTVTAQVGGVTCQVTYAGSQSTNVGLDQVNIALPNSLAGRGVVDVVFNVDGVAANTVQVTIQ